MTIIHSFNKGRQSSIHGDGSSSFLFKFLFCDLNPDVKFLSCCKINLVDNNFHFHLGGLYR